MTSPGSLHSHWAIFSYSVRAASYCFSLTNSRPRSSVSSGVSAQHVVARERINQGKYQPDETIPPIFEQLQDKNLIVKSWPDTLKLNGSPGNYEAVLEYGSQVDCVTAGVVLAERLVRKSPELDGGKDKKRSGVAP